MAMEDNWQGTFSEGVKDGIPVFLGYFPTAVAYGLLTRTSSYTFVQSVLSSLCNYAGAGQFLTVNLLNAGSAALSIILAVFFLNSRYIFMASSLSGKLRDRTSVPGRILCGFAVTDEFFAIASFKGHPLNYRYIAGLFISNYSGWISGTAVGYAAGMFLPEILRQAAMITCYAMFASLLGDQVRANVKALLVFAVSAAINTLLRLSGIFSTGISFLVSMLAAAVVGAIIFTDEEAGL